MRRDVRPERVRSIDPQRSVAKLDDGTTLDFDVVIVCIGAKPRVAFGHAETLRTSGEPIDINGLWTAAEHPSKRIAFVVPPTGVGRAAGLQACADGPASGS